MTDDIEEAVARAAEIADKVPPELRVAAFEKAFDALVGKGGTHSGTGATARRIQQRKKQTAKSTKPAGAKRGARVGGRGSLNELLEEGYFKEARTLPTIISHLRDSRARKFKQNELSGSLARMTRDGRLQRKKNTDGKYEYKAP